MNQNKLKDYTLTASVHTLAIKSPGFVSEIDEAVEDCITASSREEGSERFTTSVINPNKLQGDIYSFSDFEIAFSTILAGAGIHNYKIVRGDLRLDSFDEKHYRSYEKLNKYLISCMAVAYKFKNCYRATDLFSEKQLSVAIKNKYTELENYDKERESFGSDPAKSRLEERSKAWKDKDIKAEFTDHWFKRWDKALRCLDEVQARYNHALEEKYFEELRSKEVCFRSLTDFLLQHKDCIFTKAQLVDLIIRLTGLDKDKAIMKATNFKKRYKIELFSAKDVETAVSEIKRATLAFFES